MTEYYERLAAFLSELAATKDGGPIPPDPTYIRDAINLLISEGYFTEADLKRQALRDYDVIIHDRFFIR